VGDVKDEDPARSDAEKPEQGAGAGGLGGSCSCWARLGTSCARLWEYDVEKIQRGGAHTAAVPFVGSALTWPVPGAGGFLILIF